MGNYLLSHQDSDKTMEFLIYDEEEGAMSRSSVATITAATPTTFKNGLFRCCSHTSLASTLALANALAGCALLVSILTSTLSFFSFQILTHKKTILESVKEFTEGTSHAELEI